MSQRVQHQKPAPTAEGRAWLKENVAAQKKRYAAIVKEMNELESQRQKWFADFLRIVSTRGFNADGDRRVVIPAKQLPKKPKGKSKVVF
jgi:hypothetical protein